ncbi:MAG: hypothetical protein N2558_02440 [Patescibacteria group bacterium]|nr:hypothetical protein [Patescibacteria group bacterium]
MSESHSFADLQTGKEGETNNQENNRPVIETIKQIMMEQIDSGKMTRHTGMLILNGLLKPVHQSSELNPNRIAYPTYGRALYANTESALADALRLPTNELEPLKSALEQLHKKEGRPVVVIDLLSGPEMIKSLKKRGAPTGIYIAVGLGEDLRSQEEIEEDAGNGIYYIHGDINDQTTWEKMEIILSGRKADFVICDAGGGMIDAFEEDVKKLQAFIKRTIDVLNENGHLAIDYCVNPLIENAGLNSLRRNTNVVVIKEPNFSNQDYTIVVKKSE